MEQPGGQQPSHCGRESPAHAFDVYARAFVPEELRSINIQPAIALHTLPSRTIDYDAYARHFIPPLFLQSRPDDHALDQKKTDYEVLCPNQPVPLSAETHAIFFCGAIRKERRALERDLANYAMYRVPMDVHHQYSGAAHLVLHVPGVRENSPRIELEDVVSIRQLVASRAWDGVLQMGCTGIMYSTRVHLIDRAKELVTLRTDHGHTLMPINLGFNVCFNAPLGWIEAQRLSLALIQDSLDYSAPTLANGNSKTHHTTNGVRGRAEADAEISEQGQASWIRRMLFPEDSDGALQTELTRLAKRKLFDEELNFEQQKAVDSVCQHNYGEVPFLISGPPGTGKTKTIILSPSVSVST
ncbi:DNA helicase UvrD/REP type [Neofusicoccum parvum]|nr:DNA helicase UvrD/REP type [Neofusicoccum parvum]